ncbi:MAG: manganese efflux pump MntP family protein [Methanobacteriaceae archaeon]|jgi:putative Mn2+ efflux pump MntP|nr:manganese efflux pump MntP family protein [Methanobacteriaceae archaeon]
MDIIAIIIIAIALSMDAFSVSISQGFKLININGSQTIAIGLFFGAFHIVMPILGWFACWQIRYIISSIAPILGFLILVAIGIKMIHDCLSDVDRDDRKCGFSFKNLLILAIATSIDAFAIGISFSLLNIPVFTPAIMIGLITAIFSILGVKLGKSLGDIFGDKLEVFGGLILIVIGFKMLIQI